MKALILGDLNVGVPEEHMKSFCETYNLKSLIKQMTCYKSLSTPTCIDIILINVPCSFQRICATKYLCNGFVKYTSKL